MCANTVNCNLMETLSIAQVNWYIFTLHPGCISTNLLPADAIYYIPSAVKLQHVCVDMVNTWPTGQTRFPFYKTLRTRIDVYVNI